MTETSETNDTPVGIAPGADVIADVVKRLPNGPGVYRMIDAKGTVLYVGDKSHQRLSQYESA